MWGREDPRPLLPVCKMVRRVLPATGCFVRHAHIQARISAVPAQRLMSVGGVRPIADIRAGNGSTQERRPDQQEPRLTAEIVSHTTT